MKPKIAIIGAGISGLTLAQELSKKFDVSVFEKSRGVSGRMSTRYAEPFFYDHGAPYFTARTKKFSEWLKPYFHSGHLQEWHGKVIDIEVGKKDKKRLWFEPHLVASPNMNSLCKKMAEGLAIHLETEISPLSLRDEQGWHLQDAKGSHLGVFDWVISTAPPAQTIRLFGDHLPEKCTLKAARMQACMTLMVGFDRPWDKKWIAAKVRNNPIQWIFVNSTKPSRNPDTTCFVVHSTNDWAEDHIDDDIQITQQYIAQQFDILTGLKCSEATHVAFHRWKYAVTDSPSEDGPYFDLSNKLAATGDWNSGSNIEQTWLSAMSLAKKIFIT